MTPHSKQCWQLRKLLMSKTLRNALTQNVENWATLSTNAGRKGRGKEGQGPKQHEKGRKHKGKEKAKTADSMTNQNITMFMAHVANVAEEGNATTSWVVDSGASSHMSAHHSLFQSYEILHTPRDISIANCLKIKAIGIGTVPIDIKVNNQMQPTVLKNVLHVPDLSTNLLSIPTMAKCGIEA